MLNITPVSSSRFEGAIELSDLPAELHIGLKRYADQVSCESDRDGVRPAAVDFEGAATDRAPDAVVRALLDGSLAASAYPAPEDVFDWSTLDAQGYAAHLLAARHLKTVLDSNVVFRDRVAIRIHAS